MFRDSFGELLYPYLADSFERAHFSRQSAYDLTKIGATQADVVMIELVERNIRWLMEQPAVFPAPEREEGIPDAAEGEAFVSPARSGAPEGYIRVEGETAAQPDPIRPFICSWTEEGCTKPGFRESAHLRPAFRRRKPARYSGEKTAAGCGARPEFLKSDFPEDGAEKDDDSGGGKKAVRCLGRKTSPLFFINYV